MIFALDCSGAKGQCEEELKAAAECLARCIGRNTTGLIIMIKND